MTEPDGSAADGPALGSVGQQVHCNSVTGPVSVRRKVNRHAETESGGPALDEPALRSVGRDVNCNVVTMPDHNAVALPDWPELVTIRRELSDRAMTEPDGSVADGPALGSVGQQVHCNLVIGPVSVRRKVNRHAIAETDAPAPVGRAFVALGREVNRNEVGKADGSVLVSFGRRANHNLVAQLQGTAACDASLSVGNGTSSNQTKTPSRLDASETLGNTSVYSAKSGGKDKYCTFCLKVIKSKMARHLLQVHADEPEVVRIRLMPKRSKERISSLNLLSTQWNFQTQCTDFATGRRSRAFGH
jgi:hypothetical protein